MPSKVKVTKKKKAEPKKEKPFKGFGWWGLPNFMNNGIKTTKTLKTKKTKPLTNKKK